MTDVQLCGVFQIPGHAAFWSVSSSPACSPPLSDWRPHDPRLVDLLGAVLYRPRMAHIHRRKQMTTLRVRLLILAALLATVAATAIVAG